MQGWRTVASLAHKRPEMEFQPKAWPAIGSQQAEIACCGFHRQAIKQVDVKRGGRSMLTREKMSWSPELNPGSRWRSERRIWIPALISSELPEPDCAPVRVQLLGEELVAFRDSEGGSGLLTSSAPTRGPTLLGRNEESGLRCVYHGWKFDVAAPVSTRWNEPPDCSFAHKVRHYGLPHRRAGWESSGPIWGRREEPTAAGVRVDADARRRTAMCRK